MAGEKVKRGWGMGRKADHIGPCIVWILLSRRWEATDEFEQRQDMP